MEHDELFDAKFLGQLRSLFFRLRKRRQLKQRGLQQTPSTGFTREFKDHRQYTPGDDYRAIDWRLFARLDRLFIRLFEEIQEYHVHVLVDTSVSMVEPYPRKRVASLRLAAALAYLAMINGHKVSIMSLRDSVRRELPPIKGQGHIHELLDHLASLPFDAVTDLENGLRQFRPARDRKGIVFLISDLFGRSPETSAEALANASRWPAETHAIHVLEPAEMRPDLEGELQLMDVETREVRRMWLTKRDVERYAQTFDAFVDSVKETCVRHQVNYVTWRTNEPFEGLFLHLLSRGSALARS